MTPSWVTIDLDTTAPLLVLDAPQTIEPPDPWIVIVRSNEDLGPVAVTFTDSLGATWRPGFERIGLRTLTIQIPTVGLSSGAGELRVIARDRACNATTSVAYVAITRPRAFDVDLTLDTGLEVSVTIDEGFSTDLVIGHDLDVATTIIRAYEAESDLTHDLDITLEIY